MSLPNVYSVPYLIIPQRVGLTGILDIYSDGNVLELKNIYLIFHPMWHVMTTDPTNDVNTLIDDGYTFSV